MCCVQTFRQPHYQTLYNEGVEISPGRPDTPGATIRDRFNAAYVFSDLNHDAFLDEAADDPVLEEVYRDQYAVIFAVQP